MSGLIRHLAISQSHVFLVNSRLGHFSAPASLQDPFSRSYGVNLPSSLAMSRSSTLGFSPFPPVSVYGTGCIIINDTKIFLEVRLPSLSNRPKTLGTVKFRHRQLLTIRSIYLSLTNYSVSRRMCHNSVSPSLIIQVMEY